MQPKQLTLPEKYKNRAGQEFEYTIYRHPGKPENDYWLYTIQAKHAAWGFRSFGVYAIKASFPQQDQAELLVKTLAVEEMKGRLETATEQGFPMVFPTFSDGWFLL